MDLSHQFTVPASVDDAWDAFNDLEMVAPCFPGAALTSYDGETFTGLVKIKLGPISMQYSGTGRFLERDKAAYRAVIEAKGKDKRGNGTAAATVTAELVAEGDRQTAVSVRTDLNITGKPAQFGRGVMQDVSDKLLGQFAACLESKMSEQDTDATAEPPQSPQTSPSSPSLQTSPAAETSPAGETSPAAAETSAPAGSTQPTPAPQLDLGSTVLPIMVKRYGPGFVGGVVVLWLVRKLLRRR